MTWKEKARPAIERALGHGNFKIKGGVVVGENIPDDLSKRVAASMADELAERVAARKAQVEPRGQMIRDHFHSAFRLCDVVITQGMQKFGGFLPEEITAKDPELLLWGHWLRDMKRAIDQSGGIPPALLPFPPLPSWFETNPGVCRLCEGLGVPA